MTDDAGGRRSHGRLGPEAVVEEGPVWLQVNGTPAVTWMCTPDQLEELAVGWLFGEGYIVEASEVVLRPCATDTGFWATVPEAGVAAVAGMRRRPVLASGCGAVSTFVGEASDAPIEPPRGAAPAPEALRALFKALFARGERYRDTGGIHAAALTDGATLLHHAEDVGRHNAVDKVIGAALLAGRQPAGLGLVVTGRISAELAFKAARAGIAWVATQSVPTTLAVEVARRTGVMLVARAASGTPHAHGASAP